MTRRKHDVPAADPAQLLPALPLSENHAAALLESGLLELALTHRSFSYENNGVPHNERLEFLGDAVLQLYVTEELFHTHPTLPEGDLSRRRSATVNMRALAMVATQLGLGPFIRLGRGETLSGGREKSSILADTTEALIGAVHESCGQNTSREFVLTMMRPLLESDEFLIASYDFKSRLQEIAAETGTNPQYATIGHGPENDRRYECTVTVPKVVVARGEGRSKKDAEHDAAQRAVREVLAARNLPLLPHG